MLPHNGFLHVALFASALSIQVPSTRADDAYRSEIERFRQLRVADLKAEDGWLSVVEGGAHWLHQGESRLGSDPSSDILLPAGAPAIVGSLILGEDLAVVRAVPEAKITRQYRPSPRARSARIRGRQARRARHRRHPHDPAEAWSSLGAAGQGHRAVSHSTKNSKSV